MAPFLTFKMSTITFEIHFSPDIKPCYRLPDVEESEEAEKVLSALTTSRATFEKLRQRATVLKVAQEQGWHVAKKLATLQDQEEDPLLKKVIKNATKRYNYINISILHNFSI